MDARNQLPPTAACVIGAVFIVLGAVAVLGSVGVLPLNPSPDLAGAHWVGVCVGLIFVLGGGAVILDYAIAGGTDANGNLPAGTPFAVRVLQYLLGFGIMGCMTATFSWVAFGSGPRHFSGGFAVPFVAWGGAISETAGRVAFGAMAVLMWLMLLGVGVAGARGLLRDRRE